MSLLGNFLHFIDHSITNQVDSPKGARGKGNMLNNKKTTLRLPVEDYEALLNLSLDTGLTVNALMIVALLKHLGEI